MRRFGFDLLGHSWPATRPRELTSDQLLQTLFQDKVQLPVQ